MSHLPAARVFQHFHGTSRIRRVTLATVLGTLLCGLLATGVSAAPRPLTFDISIGDYCVYGQAKSNAFLRVIVTDPAGSIVGRDATTADSSGAWYFCIYQGSFAPGYTINAKVFSTGQVRNFVVPKLTLAVNRGTDVVSGKAPANSELQLEVYDNRWDFWGESYDDVEALSADAGGNYSFDFGNNGIDILGGALAFADWYNADQTVHVRRVGYAPIIALSVGRSEFAGASRPNGLLHVTLSQPQGTKVAAGNAIGSYQATDLNGQFADSDGEPYIVQGGEWLSAPALGSGSHWRVPMVDGDANVANDTVSGTCFPNGRYGVVVFGSGFEFGVVLGNAAGNGDFVADLSDQMNVRRGDSVLIGCWTASGDEVDQSFAAN